MDKFTPQREPIAWGTLTGLIIAVVASYGFDITPELRELLLFAVPILAGALWARFQVYAPATVKRIEQQAENRGFVEGRTEASMDGVA